LIGLTALGIRSISVSSAALSAVSKEVSKLDVRKCSELADTILSMDSALAIYSILKNFYQDNLE
jgi:phosphoenolpyruvate-protein kinase (PTS system EI component)